MSEAALRRQVERIAAELARTQAEVQTLRRAARRPQLGDSSIDSGALEVRDPGTGATRLRLGYQPDGTVGVISEGGDPPPVPAGLVVEGIPAGLSVTWNATLSGDGDLPGDFDHVNVHVSEQDGFTPDEGTFVGTITRAGGSLPVAPLEVGTTYYVRLVGVTTSGVQGEPSAQASGVPEAVGGVPGPGSITETEIADDAISTPKLQAEAVTALKIAANAIEAGHILAGAVTAAKLESDLVLGTRIIAGSPGGARVELDDTGIRGYTDADELAFVIDDTGDAIFSGDIVGSEISGSRFLMGSAPGPHGTIEQTPNGVQVSVQSDTMQAALAAFTTQALFGAVSDAGNPSSPQTAFAALSDQVVFAVNSSASQEDWKPSVAGSAFPHLAQLVVWSRRNDLGAPRASLVATETRAEGAWTSGSGATVQVIARADWTGISVTPENSTVGQPPAVPGFVYGFRRGSTDAPTLSLQSPMSESGPGAERRSIIHVEGANTTRPHTVINHAARHHYLQGELVSGSTDTTTDGVVELAPTHSLSAPRHAPVRTDMAAQPTASGDGNFHDFTTGQMPAVAFKTGWSGRARVTITMCGINNNTNASTIALGFRLSGAGTVPASLQRAAMVRSMGSGSATTAGRQQSVTVYLDLAGNAGYTLTPMWRISGSTPWSSHQLFDLNYQNSIVVEPLL